MRSVDVSEENDDEFTDDIIEGLWENGRDLDHPCPWTISARKASDERSDRTHHDKRIVLSVHHAAECVCNMRNSSDLTHLASQEKSGKVWFPSLSDAIKQLQLPINAERLSPAERQLFSFA